MNNNFFEEIKRLKAISDVGLLYCSNEYDKERYTELQEISFRLMQQLSGRPVLEWKEILPLTKDYPTAKVDIRALILSSDNKLLLVRESIDQKWSLPGGWADVGFSPKEVIIKECKEETGMQVIPEKLLAVFDKKKHPHPPQPFSVYKLVFYCRAVSSVIEKGFDVLDVQYFAIDNLPVLSEDRILKSQIEILYDKIMSSNFQTYFD